MIEEIKKEAYEKAHKCYRGFKAIKLEDLDEILDKYDEEFSYHVGHLGCRMIHQQHTSEIIYLKKYKEMWEDIEELGFRYDFLFDEIIEIKQKHLGGKE